MPNPRNRRTGQQWRECDRCGLLWPMNALTVQKGLVVCGKCLDNLEVERRPSAIGQVLGQPTTEGADLRVVDLAFNPGNELV